MLTAKRVERTKTPGRYRDGMVRGLLLQVSSTGAKSWVLRFERHGKEHMMGLGSCATFTLKEARERARAARQLLADGVDPLAAKHAARSAAKQAEARRLVFREAVRRFFRPERIAVEQRPLPQAIFIRAGGPCVPGPGRHGRGGDRGRRRAAGA